jgi:protein phosphatase
MLIPGGKRLRVTQEALSLRELLTMIESGVHWWRQQLQSADQVTRQHAAAAIKDLSRILDSLSEQLAQGRETVRITTRLPVARRYSVGCPTCGRGNRAGARFCLSCGSLLPDTHNPQDSRPDQPEPLRLHSAVVSDVGRVRQNNEDTCAVAPLPSVAGAVAHMLLVADGMGGAHAGEVASQLAGETVQQTLRSELQTLVPPDDAAWQDLLRRAVLAANQRVYSAAQAQSEQQGMGTTLTLIVVVGDRAHMAHVGDSRAYLCNAAGVTEEGEPLLQLSSDHTLVARLVDIGQLTPEQSRTHPHRNALYRALGTEPTIDVDTGSHALRSGDRLLLCSDGLTTYVEDTELAQIVLQAAPPRHTCRRLVTLANERGGQDNVSVIVATVEGA